jgi:hypothetical protein
MSFRSATVYQKQDPAAFSAVPGAGDSAEAADFGADRGAPTVVFDRPASPPGAPPSEPLDIRALLHPTEHSRLLIALSSSAVVFGIAAMIAYAGAGWMILAEYGGYLAAFGVAVWLSLQIARSRLLGGAVRVSETTLPELQAVFDEIRARLDYHKRVDVYVMDKVAGGSAMTSYLGTRLIQIEGDLAAELLDQERHAELTYLIGRHIGQLKARHQRLTPIFLAISVVDSLKFLKPFLAPYLRATAKSGDQIAAACCGDIRATAGMMNRLLVGKDLGPRLVVKGILDQAATVRRRWLPRLAQLFMNTPHATNRYLNLLVFFARTAPAEINTWRASLDQATAARLTAVIEASPNRRPPRRRASLVSLLAATVVTGGLLALGGWVFLGNAGSAASSTSGGNTSTTQSSPTGQASTGQTPAGDTQDGGQADTASRHLLARVPKGLVASCTSATVSGADALSSANAQVVCTPQGTRSPHFVSYTQYREPASLQSAYASLTHGVPSGNCTSVSGQGSYTLGSSGSAGDLACYVNGVGQKAFLWTDNRLDILSYAASASMTFADLYRWWQGDSGPESGPGRSQASQSRPVSGITATLSTYFDAINARNYRLAWSQLSPAARSGSPYYGFANGESSTTIAGWQLHRIAPGPRPGTYVAFVTFRSHQNPSQAPNHIDPCDDWTLNYTMTPASGGWLINQVNPHSGVAEYHACG